MHQAGLSRRAFLERLGACAAGGAAFSQAGLPRAAAQNVKWNAPPVLNSPNILVVMVDQMRWPQWLSAGHQRVLKNQLLPNILGKLADRSYVFEQHYAAATVCTAARGALLTGLWAPQSAVYTEIANTSTPYILNTAFPNWGQAVPALNPAYKNNVWWFGKWHLSGCDTPDPLQPYGFKTRTYPGGPNGNPSPDGVSNEGVNGGPRAGRVLASDAQIADDFIDWLKGQAPTTKPITPWCATVSLINPHDIADAPSYPTFAFPKDKFPPPSHAPALLSERPSPWNYEDLRVVKDKPPLQYAYQASMNKHLGRVTDWVTFLNQYYWLQNYVDQQVGRVLTALENSGYAKNTVIVFASDHGEFGGSHGIHDKGSAAYEESIHVPLYVSFPGQAQYMPMGQMCSGVDFFGLICDLATGGGGLWRVAYPDLAARQSIWDFLYLNSPETRVVPVGPLAGMPYIFHTSDKTAAVKRTVNDHVTCLRTKSGVAPGAKICTYSTWAPCTVLPNNKPLDFEFYDYSHNTAEMGNDYSPHNSTAQAYLSTMGNWAPATGLIATELNKPLIGIGNDAKPLTEAQAAAQFNYFDSMRQKCKAG